MHICVLLTQNSVFHPSPLSSLTFRPYSDEDYAPTIPSTPLPDSVDYARSKVNPLARTIAAHRRRSLELPAIPPVPIIAPPGHLPPTVVRGAEDHAIDRVEALLFRERAERERDGLSVHDDNRKARLIAIYGTNASFSRRGSASTSGSSDNYSQWEDESTFSATDSQGSQVLAPSVSVQTLTERYRVASRKAWSTFYGIADDFRKEITRWILEVRSTFK